MKTAFVPQRANKKVIISFFKKGNFLTGSTCTTHILRIFSPINNLLFFDGDKVCFTSNKEDSLLRFKYLDCQINSKPLNTSVSFSHFIDNDKIIDSNHKLNRKFSVEKFSNYVEKFFCFGIIHSDLNRYLSNPYKNY